MDGLRNQQYCLLITEEGEAGLKYSRSHTELLIVQNLSLTISGRDVEMRIDEYRQAYRKAFDFHAKHINATSENDWISAADGLAMERDEFTRRLLQTVYIEIERKNAPLSN